MTSWYHVIRAVAWVTFREMVRDKILYNIFFFSVALLGLGYLGAQMTYAHPDRMILDFGASAIRISCALIACLTGATLLTREFERRTAQVALSHPISRAQFVTGKFFGIALLLLVNWLLLTSALLIILTFTSTLGLRETLSYALLWTLFLGLIQGIVVASLALFFSTFTTTSLTLMFTAGLYLIGNNITEIRNLAVKSPSEGTRAGLTFLARILPNFEHFNLGNALTYGLPVAPSHILGALLYGVTLITLFLLLSGWLIRTKEL